MKVKTSRLYYFPLYLISILFFLIFPNLISLFLIFFVIISIEIYISTHYMEIKKNREVYIFRGIVNKKIIKLKEDLISSISLERNIYLSLFNLYNLKIKIYDEEYKIEGIKNGEKILNLLSK